MTPSRALDVRLAQPADAALVAAILSAAAAKLMARGHALWSAAEVSEAAVAPHIRGGLYHLATAGDEAVGVFRLQEEDPAFWPEVPAGTSLFLHKLAVIPQRQGQGFAHQLLAHAVRITRERGLRYLRLDCMAGRPRLRAVYEEFGFRPQPPRHIGSVVFDRFAFDVEGAES